MQPQKICPHSHLDGKFIKFVDLPKGHIYGICKLSQFVTTLVYNDELKTIDVIERDNLMIIQR